MIDAQTLLGIVAVTLGVSAAGLAALLIYLAVRYVPVITRIFHEQPLFFPLRLTPKESGESVKFVAEDGIPLAGTYFAARTSSRAGLVVFCHEFLSNRWSCQAYVDSLRSLGFDLFAFDFRNHGESGKGADYTPTQWLTDFEVRDLRAALAYLRTRPDHDPAGFALFGVSRGGNAALVAAAEQPDVWGVVTDGAFPTSGTMYAYIMKWAEIYLRYPLIRKLIPDFCYHYVAWMARLSSQRSLKCRFPSVERAVAKLAPRPWFAIHGEKDTYIKPEIARELFDYAQQPKNLWVVAGAKHNKCREKEPEAYSAQLLDFMDRFAPRRLVIDQDQDQTEEAIPTKSTAACEVLVPSRLISPVESDEVCGEVSRQLSS